MTMILLVDAGNTRIKWATLEGAEMGAASVASQPASGVYAEWFEAWRVLPKPDRVVVANVAGAACAEALRAWVVANWRCELEFVTAREQAYGVVNAYDEATKLGVDRWLALVAARRVEAGPVCVIDCGSALTVDVMAGDGRHLGGLIMPGLAMMRRALSDSFGVVRRSMEREGQVEVSLLARDTREAVIGGTLYTLVAVIDRIVGDVSEALSVPVTGILSGGDAVQLLPLLAGDFHHQPNLVLKGLAVVAQESP